MRSLPLQHRVYSVNPSNGAETIVAQTDYEYDRYDSSAHHADLVNRANISGIIGRNGLKPAEGYNPMNDIARGNLTATSAWLNTTGGAITTYLQYDIAGNVVKSIDAGRSDGSRSATVLDYTDRYGSPDGEAQSNSAPASLNGQSSFAFATFTTNALGHVSYIQFDYYLGKSVDVEDANGKKSSGYYNDGLDRPTKVERAVNVAAVKTQVTFSYDDANRTITTTSDRDNFNDNLLQTKIRYDGLGRI